MTIEDANRTIREAVAARMAATPAGDDKLIGYQPPDCPGCEGHPFRAKVTGVSAAQATAIDLTRELPPEFVEATRNYTFRPATPTPPAEFKTQRIGATMTPEQLEAAWAGVKARREEAIARMRGAPIETIENPLELPVTKTRLVGLTGPAGCGKNLVAGLMPDAECFGFADPIYAALSAMFDLPEEWLRDRANKDAVIPWIGKSPRQLLQTLGTEWGRGLVRADIWIRIAGRRINELTADRCPAVVISDVRFDNEAQMIRDRGGEVWRIERTPASETYAHVSEAGISGRLIDLTIDNTGTPDETRERVMDALSR